MKILKDDILLEIWFVSLEIIQYWMKVSNFAQVDLSVFSVKWHGLYSFGLRTVYDINGTNN